MGPDSDSAVVAREIVTSTTVIEEELDIVVVTLAELRTGVAVGTGTAVVWEVGIDIAVERVMTADTSLAVLGLGTDPVEGLGLDTEV